MAHLDLDTLDSRLKALSPAPREVGRVEQVVLRLPGEKRRCPGRITLDVEQGAIGDRWASGRLPDVLAQITVMRADVAMLMCDGADIAILGDNLFVSLDTSASALPPGTRLRVGLAICEVTKKPHTGCSKFSARVGPDAWAIAKRADWQPMQLRGVHLRVLTSGQVCEGDQVIVEFRPERSVTSAAEPMVAEPSETGEPGQ